MADLSGDDRGQILLVAAFALAVIFVAMALIVNSAIFTENLASRGETAGSGGALSMRTMVEANVGDAITAANRNNNTSTATLTSAVTASIGNISAQTGRQSIEAGRVVAVENPSYTTGRRIYESNNTNLTNGAGDENYQLVGNIGRVTDGNGTRAFEIAASSVTATDNASAFTIRVQRDGVFGNTNSWRARIWEVPASETIHVRTLKNDGGGADIEDCEVTPDGPGSTVHLDITGGTIDNEPCDALGTTGTGDNFHFAAGTDVGTSDTYSITFQNAENITGNFSMIVNRDSGINLDGLPNPVFGTSRDIQIDPALYDATVRYTYLTTDLRYETDIRVAPGEPDA